MSYIFISYSHKDKDYVHKLQAALQDEGLDVWIDDRIDFGTTWPKVIQQHLDDCSAFIVVMTEDADESVWVQNEVTRAQRKKKPFFALLLKGEPWLSVEAIQYEDVTGNKLPSKKLYDSLALAIAREEKAAREKLERDATEKLAREREEQENAEKIAREEAERKAVEKVAREKLERDAAEKLARKKEEQENAKKIAREKAEREAAQKKQAAQKQPANKPFPAWLVVLGIILIAIVGVIVAINQHPSTSVPAATATFTALPISTETFTVLSSPTETLTPEPPTIIPTSTPGILPTMISPRDGMKLLYVPAGNFLMGSADSDPDARANEKPEHTVYLDAFWIDQTDVTDKMYAFCVSANQCNPPSNPSSDPNYYGNSEYRNYPVIYVSWGDAMTYCKWAARQLPTEAQWEKAARGTDGRIYPWGNDAPDTTLLNYTSLNNHYSSGTTAVGSYPNGASPYGALDMAGDVWQWVNDWYNDSYYQSSPSSNPLGPDSGEFRVLRGGTWDIPGVNYSAYRGAGYPANVSYDAGFRCAMSAPK